MRAYVHDDTSLTMMGVFIVKVNDWRGARGGQRSVPFFVVTQRPGRCSVVTCTRTRIVTVTKALRVSSGEMHRRV